MRYIEKEEEPEVLTNWKIENQVTLNEMYQNEAAITSDVIWRFLDDCQEDNINKNIIKKQLVQEQGYLCCYCGSRINIDHNTAIEHLKSKSLHRSLTYDYGNLLASCMGGSKPIIHKVIEGENINSISALYGVDIAFLEAVYVDTQYPPNQFPDLENLQIGDRLIIFRRLKGINQHCDTKKGNNSIEITPIQTDCSTKFNYDKRTGAIIETTENRNTIAVLGLNNNPYLHQNRLKVINEGIRKIRLIFEHFPEKNQRKEKLQQLILNLNQPNENNQLRPFYFVETSILQGN